MRNSELQRQNPEFIAVDVDIKSAEDLAPLVSALERKVHVTYVTRLGRRHWFHLMLIGSPRTPSVAIRQYAKIFDRLPQRAKRLLRHAAKEFDIGFKGGLDPTAENLALALNEWVLSAKDIETVARLGASVRVKIYASKYER